VRGSLGMQEVPGPADYYTDCYNRFAMHREMLGDRVRTETYLRAMERNKHLFQGKIVLDVGCGTGVLAMFAARAGAARVIGVDMSTIALHARQVVEDNGLQGVVTILHGKVEEVELPVTEVDILVSEWMGYCLFYESMLDSVLFARDKWLAPGGLVLPDLCSLHLTAVGDEARRRERAEVWEVGGLSFGAMGRLASMEPSTEYVRPRALISTTCCIKKLDLNTCSREDAAFTANFSMTALRSAPLTALVAHFDVQFSACHTPTGFSTSPRWPATHWRQTVFYLEESGPVGEGEAITGTFSLRPNLRNHRDLDIDLVVEHRGEGGEYREERHYRMC